MVVPLQCVQIKWGSRNKATYTKLGIPYTKIGDAFWIEIDTVMKTTPGSDSIMTVKCDYCGIYFNRTVKMHVVNNAKSVSKKDCCDDEDCRLQKRTEGNLIKYGVENVQQVPSIREKTLSTTLEKYGVEHYVLHPDFEDKVKETSLDLYGVDHHGKAQQTVDKRRATNLKRYGVINASQTDEVKKKVANSYYKNGTIKSSRPQRKVLQMLQEEGFDAHLNYPVSVYNLDVGLFVHGEKIDVEYDGWYWHQDRQKDIDRDNYMYDKGWKVLRIKSGIKVPTLEQLTTAINNLLNNNIKYQEIVLDDWKDKRTVV